MKLHTGKYWPSPEDWQKILGPKLTEHLIADAEEIIRTGAHRERPMILEGEMND